MIKHAVSISIVLLACAAIAQKPADSPSWLALKNLEQDPALANGTVAIKAVNLDNGDVIIDHNGQKSMIPASIQKLVTTAAALETHGPNFQFVTEVKAAGELEVGKIYGDIYVMPSGDPTLQSRYYGGETSSLKKFEEILRKANSFEGRLVIDASAMNAHATPRGWMWEDMGNYFGATPTALIWRDNTLDMYLNSGQVGTRAMLSSRTKYIEDFEVDIQVEASSDSRDNAWFFSAPQTDKIYAQGTIPAHQTNFLVKASHPDPMRQFGYEILASADMKETELRIDYEYIPHKNLETLGSIVSPPLYSIVRLTNQKSINLYAEALAISLDTAKHFKSIEGGVNGVERFLKEKRVSINGLRMNDGSGLSPMNRITCETMIELLMVMQQSKVKDEFKNSLPVAGQSGTLANSFTHPSLKGKLIAKSGTMKGVRNYAGYLKNDRGEEIAICVMINDYDDYRSTAVKKKIEELMVAISED
ncbi:MAG: D-alanyl-D-alanine carboxypeptidase/D-alanyl-D-alanine-endopeptidase [Salibacteraceae bacterium]